MGAAVSAGYSTVLSAPYYLNVVNDGSNINEDWSWYYSVEPTDFEANVTEAQKESRVGGVEACMWSEWVDGANLIQRFWPRAGTYRSLGWFLK